MAFFQQGPCTPNLFEVDHALQTELRRRLPSDLLEAWWPRWVALGADTATTLVQLARRAERDPPVHIPYDPFGRRIDHIEVSAAWDELKDYAARHGLVATGHDADLGPQGRVVQTALLHLFSASSAMFSCPLAMTDAAACVLRDLGTPGMKERLLPRLLSTDPKAFITSGQWMTERAGGSDVGGTETLARPAGESPEGPRYGLTGTKWFTSATTSEMALTLARIEDDAVPAAPGSRGLSLFCIELQHGQDGERVGIEVNRLKDKLGTRALPTAELTLRGVQATRIGEAGRGVAHIATMLNVTRFYNAVASASAMARAAFLAEDYARRRRAFGKRLTEHPLHAWTLRNLVAESAGALALCFEVGELLGRSESGALSKREQARLRGLIPIAKLTLGKQAVSVASEALECFGGAGYIEDTELPRLLRDAQVLPIWEGTTNVLSLDVLRAEVKSGALREIVADLMERCGRLPAGLPATPLGALQRALAELSERLSALRMAGNPERWERNARRVALAAGHLLEGMLLAESVPHAAPDDGGAVQRFADFVTLRLAGPLAE